MVQDKNTGDFYDRLKKQLSENTSWPSENLYKFIVPSDLEKITRIESIFDGTNAIIKTKESTKGTYTSVSIHVLMESPDYVIEKYLEVSSVEGVISL